MSDDRRTKMLDRLLEEAFAAREGHAPLGFEASVMARIAGLASRENFWDVLRAVARPLLVSGWAAAAVLGLLAWSGLEQGREVAMAAIMNADSVTSWLVL